ncbi:MAG: SGNH/GDSL hydrolase family protein [Acidobacteriota bacterium]
MEQTSPIRIPRRKLTRKRRLIYAATIYLVFLGLLAAVEIGTRLALPHISSLDLFVVTAQQKAQVADEKQSGIFEADPLLLWRLKPNLDHAIWDFTILSTNADHLRSENVGETIGSKPPGTIRIVCLGDSVTFGYRVPAVWPNKPTEYDPAWLPFPMLLEKELRTANPGRKIEVITMAVPGYTSHQGLVWLRRDIDTMQPDLVIASFGWNDASASDKPDREVIKTNFAAVTMRRLIDSSQAFAHAVHWLRARQAREQQIASQQQRQTIAIAKLPVPRVSQTEYAENMLAIDDLARQRGAATIVIAAPYRDRSSDPPEAERMLQYRQALGTTMRQRGVPFLELRELTEEAYPANEGWFGERIHPNHMGHRLIASELLKLLGSSHTLHDLNIPSLVP